MRKLFFALCFVFLFLFHGYQANAENVTPMKITKGWQYLPAIKNIDKYSDPYYIMNDKTLSWVDFVPPAKPRYKSPDGEVWIRVLLPRGSYGDPGIYFKTYDQNFEMYYDAQLITKMGGFDRASKKESPGAFWHMIHLPKQYEGHYIYLRMYSARAVNHGLVKDFILGSYSQKLIDIVKKGTLSFVHAWMYIFVGLFSFFFSLIKKANRKLFLYLSLSAMVTGAWLLAESEMKQFFISNAGFCAYVDIVSQYSIPIFYALFLNELLENKYRKIVLGIAFIHSLVLFGSVLSDLLDLVPLVATLNIFYISFGINMAIMVLLILRSFKEWNTDIKIFTTGFSVLCLTGIYDLLNSVNRYHENIMCTKYGVLVLLSSFAILIIYNIFKAQNKVTKYMDELSSKDEILSEKNKQLDDAMVNEKLKNEFFSNLSHELKTPLNIILSTIQLLTRYSEQKLISSPEKDIDRYLYIMKQNSYRLIRLVNNMIDLTKIDAGYLNTEMKNNDIVAVVEDITQSVADYIKRNGISIVFDTDVEEKIIACDPDKIERIILNLLSNAVKFSKPGSSILVDVKDKGAEIEIQVQDTGIGLAPDKLDVIFERFAQVDKSLTRNHEGSGIGLSLVKSLVEMHGGRIAVKSKYGYGSTFTITLPAKTVEIDEKEVDESEIQAVHVEKVNIEFSDIYS